MTDFEIVEQETDLWISMDSSFYYPDLEEETRGFVVELREALKSYIEKDYLFLTSLKPRDVLQSAPAMAADMAKAARKAGVGPMAAVAGAVAREAGRFITQKTGCCKLLVENGGDIYIRGHETATVAVYAGASPLSERVGIRVNATGELGVCSSSGTVGHSLSFGLADAVAVVSQDVLTADAYATAYCNQVKCRDDISTLLEKAKVNRDIKGVVVIIGDALGAWGDLKLMDLG